MVTEFEVFISSFCLPNINKDISTAGYCLMYIQTKAVPSVTGKIYYYLNLIGLEMSTAYGACHVLQAQKLFLLLFVASIILFFVCFSGIQQCRCLSTLPWKSEGGKHDHSFCFNSR